ncbi:MAG TPA: glycosyl hydrolase [Acidimicrobiales bacterium]|nr:glycosyl hydrolase [Acidimicrobiales bacterium]
MAGPARAPSAARPVRLLGRTVVAGCLLSAGVVGLVSAPTAAQPVIGPGTLSLTPSSLAPSSAGNTLGLRYTASAGDWDGTVSVLVPGGWPRPQTRSSASAGYVSATTGRVSVRGHRVTVGGLYLCKGCTVTVTYAHVTAPASPRTSVFSARSANLGGRPLHRLLNQPALRVVWSGRTMAFLGDYVGADDPGGVRAFAAATGTHPLLAADYLVGSNGWGAMESTSGLGSWKGSGYRLVLGVPIIPDGTGATLASGAAGAYNAYFVTLARNLVSAGFSNAILRLGWEFNANWYNWGVSNPTDAAHFAAYWRNIVTAMRSVSGQAFQFLWNPNGQGPTSYTPSQAYPGDAYVNYVGTDVYDNCWCSPQTPQDAWSLQMTQPWGLNWLASFAAQQGKPIAFPEWSVDFRTDGHGLGDDPYFINQFANWITTHDVVFTDMFSFNTSDQRNDITDGHFPKALAAFKADFG